MANTLGLQFETKKGATVTVIGVDAKRNVEVECSICSKDAELFSKPLITKLDRLRQGKFPCGCGRPTWSPEQYRVLITRLLQGSDFSFVKFLSDKPKAKDKVNLSCKHHGDFFLSYNTLSNLGTRCPKCSETECRDAKGQFKVGQSTHRTPESVKLERVQKILGNFTTPATFVRFVGNSHVEINCSEHGDYLVNYQNLVRKGYRCGKCSGKSSNILYIGLITDGEIPVSLKIGKTNSVDRRFSELNRKNPLDIELLFSFVLTPEQCSTLENEIKRNFDVGFLDNKDYPSGFSETLPVQDLEKLLRFIAEFNNG